MRAGREVTVEMFCDAMKFFSYCVNRINMDRRVGKIAQMVQELVSDLDGNLVASSTESPGFRAMFSSA
jgi:hypothetical protein